MKYFSVLASSP
uniref:Uncharacterized protein n=1 Tax=Lepeophtheirus salmonis TaxID=72036 RepID=A0A0K2UVK1_LEPSM